MADEILFSTLTGLADRLARGDLSATEIMQAFIDRTAAVDGQVRAFNSVNPEDALAQAQAADARRAAGECRGPLDGLPIASKT